MPVFKTYLSDQHKAGSVAKFPVSKLVTQNGGNLIGGVTLDQGVV